MGKILVVDDQFGVRSLLVSIFREDQHEVETAENGAEALRLFITFEPDLILMEMPGMNGIGTLRKIRVLDRRVAVITMTSYGDAQAMEQAKNLGILYYLGKPFDVFELIKWVREILNSSGLITKGSLLKRSLFMNNTVCINRKHTANHTPTATVARSTISPCDCASILKLNAPAFNTSPV